MKKHLMLAAALTVPSLVMATQLYAGYRLQGVPIPFAAAFVVQLCHWQLWTFFGPVVWGFAHRWPVVYPRRGQALLRHLLAGPAVAVAVLALYLAAYHAIIRVPLFAAAFAGFDNSMRSTIVFFMASYLHVELLIYGGVVAAAQTFRTTALLRARERDALRLESELTGARLAALRMQLQPHFLFNALHTVGSLVLQRQNELAVGLLAELGELLRTTLARRETDLTPLRDEIAYLERYLKIEEARFGDRLTIRWRIDEPAMGALVPPFILQPIVENAIRHGISRRTDDSLLGIAAVLDGEVLRITICNEGPPLADAFRIEDAPGFGLKNVVQRLRTRTPPGHMELANARCSEATMATGVRATLVLPLWGADTEAQTR